MFIFSILTLYSRGVCRSDNGSENDISLAEELSQNRQVFLTVPNKLNILTVIQYTFLSFGPYNAHKSKHSLLFSPFSTSGYVDDPPSSLCPMKKVGYDSSSDEFSEVVVILLGIM